MPWKATYFKYEVLNLKLSFARIFETKGGLNGEGAPLIWLVRLCSVLSVLFGTNNNKTIDLSANGASIGGEGDGGVLE